MANKYCEGLNLAAELSRKFLNEFRAMLKKASPLRKDRGIERKGLNDSSKKTQLVGS